MSGTWQRKAFGDVIEDVSGGNIKTPQGEFLYEGRYPVIDQGKDLVAGYTNDPDRLCKAKLPVIVFGDHTRCFKFVDFPFCMGADGTKVLRPQIEADPKYLYYFLRQSHFPEEGYSRHFKHLRRIEIAMPPLAEQRRIAAILDKAETLRAKRQSSNETLALLAQILFLDMFGEPISNSKKLPVVPLLSVCTRVTDGTHQPPTWAPEGHPFLFVSNIVDGEIDFATEKFISEETYQELTRRCPVELGDVLYTTVGSYGNAALVATGRKFAFQRHIAHIKPNASIISPEFLAVMLQSAAIRKQADRAARGIAQKTVNLADLKTFSIFKPALKVQLDFVSRVRRLADARRAQRSSLKALEGLFASLQHRAFRGEL